MSGGARSSSPLGRRLSELPSACILRDEEEERVELLREKVAEHHGQQRCEDTKPVWPDPCRLVEPIQAADKYEPHPDGTPTDDSGDFRYLNHQEPKPPLPFRERCPPLDPGPFGCSEERSDAAEKGYWHP